MQLAIPSSTTGLPPMSDNRFRKPIEQPRVKRAERLWIESDMSVPDIAKTTGIRLHILVAFTKSWEPRNRTSKYSMAEGKAEVLKIFTEAAQQKKSAPPDKIIASTLGVSHLSVQNWVKALLKDGCIRTKTYNTGFSTSGHNRRTVTIMALGITTIRAASSAVFLLPADADGKYPLLERAKNFIRQRGPTVYNASFRLDNVTLGIVVDGTTHSPEGLLDYARKMGFVDAVTPTYKPLHQLQPVQEGSGPAAAHARVTTGDADQLQYPRKRPASYYRDRETKPPG